MITPEVHASRSLDLKPAAARQRDTSDVVLACIEYRATRTPDDYDYQKMVEACCVAASPLLDRLIEQDYRLWLFRIGALFNSERRRRYPDYSLARSARDAGIIDDKTLLEKVFHEEDDLCRTSGLYFVDRSRFDESIYYLTIHPDSLLMLSRRQNFSTDKNLTEMYDAASADAAPRQLVAMNWQNLSMALCSHGDIVLKTRGGFDDLHREIIFISTPDVLFN